MKFLIAATLIASLNVFAQSAAQEKEACRATIVEASIALREPLDSEQFSIYDSSEFTFSAEEFNLLSSEDQESLYLLYTPIKVMAEKMRSKLNRQIEYLADGPFAFFYVDTLQKLREKRDALIDACIN